MPEGASDADWSQARPLFPEAIWMQAISREILPRNERPRRRLTCLGAAHSSFGYDKTSRLEFAMNDRLVTVATFWNSVEAELARGRLRDAGIRAFLADETMVGMAWYLGNAIGGVKLQVGDGDAEAAPQKCCPKATHRLPMRQAARRKRAPPMQSESTASPADDEADERELSAREENAERAFHGAVIGLLLMPLQLYVFWLLLKVFFSHEELRPNKRRAALWAGAINIPMLIFMAWCWRTL